MVGSRVFLCHRNCLLSECLASALRAMGPFECAVVEPDDPLVSLSKFAADAADVLMLDPTLEGDQAAALLSRFRARYPESRLILMVSASAVDRIAEFASLNGNGWILDDVSLTDVRGAIDAVLSGSAYCSPRLANALLAQLGGSNPSAHWKACADDLKLTSREREVLQLIAWEQMSNKQIARRLQVSLFTVKNHVHNIIGKLGVEDRHEAVSMAQRRRLLIGPRVG